MHIAEGVAPLSVSAGGWLLALAGVALGLRALKDEQVPRAALIAAVIFVSSSVIRLPIGPSGAHPVLCGLAGVLLGWGAAPVYLVCLFLQSLLFQFGGLSTLGVNTVVMAVPAILCGALFRKQIIAAGKGGKAFFWGAASGGLALLLAFCIWAGALVLCGEQFIMIVKIALIPHLALMLVEAVFTGFIAAFLVRIRPEIFL